MQQKTAGGVRCVRAVVVVFEFALADKKHKKRLLSGSGGALVVVFEFGFVNWMILNVCWTV